MLNNDNEESRKMVEQCYRLNKTVVNPIIDWDDAEVWEFIKEYEVPYCKLYDKGYKRLGCIGCPMSTKQEQELEKYPKFKQAYINAFDRMIKSGTERGIKYKTWKSGEEVYKWWVNY